MSIKFTIVTISYNQSRFLEKTILSVLRQDYANIEYIIVDPGSNDGSREIINRYSDYLYKIIYEPDSGPADGLNKGFSYATGEIFGYLNSDDILMPGSLRKVADYFIKNDIVDVLSGHGYVIDEEDRIVHKLFSHRFDLRRYIAGCCLLIQPSTFMRSNIYNRANKFNPNNSISWDGELAIDMALCGAKFAMIHEMLSCFRIHPESLSVSAEYHNKLIKEHERIKCKTEYGDMSLFYRKYLWATGWLLQPKILYCRIIDGIINRKRLL